MWGLDLGTQQGFFPKVLHGKTRNLRKVNHIDKMCYI